MTALRHRVRRILAEQKFRFAGIVVLVLLGSFYFTAATGVAGSLERTVDGFATANQQEDLTFTTDRPLADIAALGAGSGSTIEAQQRHDVTLPHGVLRALTAGNKVDVPTVLTGRGLRGQGEILLDPRFLQAQGLRVGGGIVLEGKPFTIVGTAAVPNYVYILKNFYDVLPTTGFGIGVVSAADMAAFSGAAANPTGTYGVRFRDRENIEAQTRNLRDRIRAGGYSISEWMSASDNPRISMAQGNIKSMQAMSFPVAVAFFLLSCVIVSVMVMRTVKSDSVVIGTLYALGYRRREMTRHYLAIPLLVAAVGAIAGMLLALLAVGPVVDSMLSAYNLPGIGTSFSPLNLAIAVLMPTVLIGAASLLVIRRILGKRVAELMKGDEQAAKVNALERALPLDRFRFATKFRIREQARSIPRLLFLILGVAAASMVMLFGLTFNNSMSVATEQGSLVRYQYPIEYNFTQIQNLQQRPLPQGAEPYHTIRVHPEGKDSLEFYLTGVEPNSVGLRLKDTSGAALPRGQVNITAPLASRLGIGVGDTVRLVSKLDGAAYTLRIDGIVQAYSEQFITMPIDDLNRMTGYPAGSYGTVLADHEMNFDKNQLAGVLDTRDPTAFDNLSAPTGLIVGSVTALAVLIAVVILFLVTSLIIDENRHSIALLKILGYRRKEIAKLILNSSTPAVILGFVLGVPLMIGFGDALFGVVADTINMVIPMVISPLHVVVTFVAIIAIYQVTKQLSSRKILRIPMSEALKAGAE
ncbi:FtsX-like permease family protein [Kutzneria viridogrisea]|uniref:ABC3 transporter permease C-terminal domain-containing protein n=2 Tax=Kutzneria TaxID=43356 RepID=W5WE26_9PSEU|nr:FtsX-like permease family protein [Kutzneria albida]AHH98831.1 hypothetical protein KALB_5469 [Kutzneria albida DSM 43870]MBA8923648.1 putative ABC transport system permease protein [Kutzneria viridogrisea]